MRRKLQPQPADPALMLIQTINNVYREYLLVHYMSFERRQWQGTASHPSSHLGPEEGKKKQVEYGQYITS